MSWLDASRGQRELAKPAALLFPPEAGIKSLSAVIYAAIASRPSGRPIPGRYSAALKKTGGGAGRPVLEIANIPASRYLLRFKGSR